MTKLICILLLSLAVTAPAQFRISMEPRTNVLSLKDLYAVDTWLSGTQWITRSITGSNLVSFIANNLGTNSFGTNGLNLTGWTLFTQPSEYEFGTTTNYGITLLSQGPQGGPFGGDGIFKLQSNLTNANGSNACFLSFKGDLSASKTGNYADRMPIFTIVVPTGAGGQIQIGGTAAFNSSNQLIRLTCSNAFWTWNFKTQLLDSAGLRIIDGSGIGGPPTFNPDGAYSLVGYQYRSNAQNNTECAITNCGLFPQYHYSTNFSTDSYYMLGAIGNLALANGPQFTNQQIRMHPFYAGSGGQIDSLAIKVVTPVVGGVVDFGLYTTISATNLYPGNLIFDSGPRDASATAVIITNLATKIHLNPGEVYYVAVRSNTNIVCNALGNSQVNGILGYTTNFLSVAAIETLITDLKTNLPATAPLTNYFLQTGAGGFATAVGARFIGP